MESQEKKSNWDELARELGATPPAESDTQAYRDVEDTAERTVPQVRPRDKAATTRPPARPKANPQDWDSLAANLGIETPVAPAAPKSPPTKPKELHMKAAEAEPLDPVPSKPVADSEDAAKEAAKEAAALESQDSRLDRPEPAREESRGSVSLWHKIFGSPDEQAERIAEASTTPERSHRRETSRPRDEDSESSDRARRDRQPDKSVDNEVEFEEFGGTTQSPSSAEPEVKKRRSRRRRGGRGRKQDAESGSHERAPARRSAEDAERPAPRRTGRRTSEGRPQPHDDDFDGVEELDLEQDSDDDLSLDQDESDDSDSRAQGLPPGHRNIPSWDEAIGLIVDTNLQLRSERRRSSPKHSRGTGSSRGGSRGRRKKKS